MGQRGLESAGVKAGGQMGVSYKQDGGLCVPDRMTSDFGNRYRLSQGGLWILNQDNATPLGDAIKNMQELYAETDEAPTHEELGYAKESLHAALAQTFYEEDSGATDAPNNDISEPESTVPSAPTGLNSATAPGTVSDFFRKALRPFMLAIGLTAFAPTPVEAQSGSKPDCVDVVAIPQNRTSTQIIRECGTGITPELKANLRNVNGTTNLFLDTTASKQEYLAVAQADPSVQYLRLYKTGSTPFQAIFEKTLTSNISYCEVKESAPSVTCNFYPKSGTHLVGSYDLGGKLTTLQLSNNTAGLGLSPFDGGYAVNVTNPISSFLFIDGLLKNSVVKTFPSKAGQIDAVFPAENGNLLMVTDNLKSLYYYDKISNSATFLFDVPSSILFLGLSFNTKSNTGVLADSVSGVASTFTLAGDKATKWCDLSNISPANGGFLPVVSDSGKLILVVSDPTSSEIRRYNSTTCQLEDTSFVLDGTGKKMRLYDAIQSPRTAPASTEQNSEATTEPVVEPSLEQPAAEPVIDTVGDGGSVDTSSPDEAPADQFDGGNADTSVPEEALTDQIDGGQIDQPAPDAGTEPTSEVAPDAGVDAEVVTDNGTTEVAPENGIYTYKQCEKSLQKTRVLTEELAQGKLLIRCVGSAQIIMSMEDNASFEVRGPKSGLWAKGTFVGKNVLVSVSDINHVNGSQNYDSLVKVIPNENGDFHPELFQFESQGAKPIYTFQLSLQKDGPSIALGVLGTKGGMENVEYDPKTGEAEAFTINMLHGMVQLGIESNGGVTLVDVIAPEGKTRIDVKTLMELAKGNLRELLELEIPNLVEFLTTDAGQPDIVDAANKDSENPKVGCGCDSTTGGNGGTPPIEMLALALAAIAFGAIRRQKRSNSPEEDIQPTAAQKRVARSFETKKDAKSRRTQFSY